MPNIAVSTNSGLKYLFTQRRGGLCMRSIVSGRFRDHTVIFPEIRGDFDATVNQNNNIEIVCQDKEHNLVLLKENNGNFSKEYILRAKEGNSINISYFRIVRVNSLAILFYCIDYGGKTMLCHQILNGGGVPEPIDYIDGKRRTFNICKASNGDIHIFYSSENSVFGERIYKWSQKSLGDFTELAERADNISVCENDGICLCITNPQGIFFRRFSPQNNQWDTAKLLTKQVREIKSCIIFGENNRLNIMWEGTNQLYSTSAAESDGMWSRIKEIPVPQNFMCERVKLINGEREMYSYCQISNGRINFPIGRGFITSKPQITPKYDLNITPVNDIKNTEKVFTENESKNELNEIRREYFEKLSKTPAEKSVPKPQTPQAHEFIKREPTKIQPIETADTKFDSDALNHLADSIEKLANAMSKNAAYPRGSATKRTHIRHRKPALATMHKKIK